MSVLIFFALNAELDNKNLYWLLIIVGTPYLLKTSGNNKKIIDAFSNKVETIVEASTALEAVAYGYRLAKKDETVLLSPACASFDLFENYEERGNEFKKAVRSL